MEQSPLILGYGLSVLVFALTTVSVGRELRRDGGWRWPAAGGLFLVAFAVSAIFPQQLGAVTVANSLGAVAAVLLVQGASALGERPVRAWPWGAAAVGIALTAWFGLAARDFTIRAEIVNGIAIILYSALAWELAHTRVAAERRLLRLAAGIVGLVVLSYASRAVLVAISPMPSTTGYATSTLVAVYSAASVAFLSLSVVFALVVRRRRTDRLLREREAAARERGRWLETDASGDTPEVAPDISGALASEIQVAHLSGRPLLAWVLVGDGRREKAEPADIVVAVREALVPWAPVHESIGLLADEAMVVLLPGMAVDQAQQAARSVQSRLSGQGVGAQVHCVEWRTDDSAGAFLERLRARCSRPPAVSTE